MFTLARNALGSRQMILSHRLAARAAALHTLPPLPYAYDVNYSSDSWWSILT